MPEIGTNLNIINYNLGAYNMTYMQYIIYIYLCITYVNTIIKVSCEEAYIII